MTRRAPLPPPSVPTFRTDEVTGTRVRERVSADLSRSPCLFARQLLDAGRVRDALEVLDKELASGTESAELQYWIGRAAFRLGDHARAQSALNRAVTLSPHDAEMHRWLARVLLHGSDAAGTGRASGRGTLSALPRVPSREPQVPMPQTIEYFDDVESEDPPTSQWVMKVKRS